MRNAALVALSPLDGRYASQTSDLSLYFSEQAIIKARLYLEITYLKFLATKKIIPAFTKKEKKALETIFTKFSLNETKAVKAIEATIHHDVKAVENYLRQQLLDKKIKNSEYIHIGLTSEDINNCVYSLAIQNSLQQLLIPTLHKVINNLTELAQRTKKSIMLAKTHGQPAVPTTMGKELIVFAIRLARELKQLSAVQLDGKLTGAVGNFNAQVAAFPQVNWPDLSYQFITQLGLKPHIYTTQILPPDSYVRVFACLQHINSILLDLDQDIWRYISDGVFTQKVVKVHVGSSTMPQKVNPIDFENSEGNLGLANALLEHFCQKLPISRLQRDLSDSTVKRSIGVAFGHCLLGYNSTLKGLKKLEINNDYLQAELDSHWEVVTEGVQTILRTTGDDHAYEKLKQFSRGKHMTQKTLRVFIEALDLDTQTKTMLTNLTPTTYIGVAEQLVDMEIEEVQDLLGPGSSLG